MNSRNLFGTVILAMLLLPATSAVAPGQNAPAADRLLRGDGEDSPPSFSESALDQPQSAGCCDAGSAQAPCCPQWTVWADFIILDRIGSFNQPLVSTVPINQNPNSPGTEVLNANDFHQGFAGGPRVGLIRHGDDGYDLELSYFQIDGWSDYRSVGPTPGYWMVMTAPGGFLQFQDNQYTQMMVWDYASQLYNAEVNLRWNPGPRITMLAGFRWVGLWEDLQGTLPPQRAVPFWDTNDEEQSLWFPDRRGWKAIRAWPLFD